MNKILHIDNSSFFINLLKKILEKKGFEYISTSELDIALEILQKQNIDLIITGLELEGGSGEEIIKKINSSLKKNIPIIINSSHDSLELRQKMFSLGILDFIPKNVSVEKITEYVTRLFKEKDIHKKINEMNIAVLDDSPAIIKIVKTIFEFHNIRNVDYYKYANDLLKSGKKYSIYLIDVILIDSRGEFVMSELIKKYQDSLIIAISGINNFEAISNILLLGAQDYIMKPFDSSIFMARIIVNVRNYLLMKELEEKNKELKKATITDGLTQLFNHKYIYEQLEAAILESKKFNKKLSIAMFDIDSFKLLNDTFGHQFGDNVLSEVSKVIDKTVKKKGIAGRYGGEEFLIIMPRLDLDEGYVLAEDIRKNIENMESLKEDFKVTISGGIVEFNGESSLALVEKADQLLYKAKSAGKNKIERRKQEKI